MKVHYTLLFCLLLVGLEAQDKYDNNWITGYLSLSVPPADPQVGGTLIQFNPDPEVSPWPIKGAMGESSIMSDKQGNLLFYTNGCAIFNRNNEVMQGGDTLNAGAYWKPYCGSIFPYPMWQGILTLPWPGNDHKYLVFHLLIDKVPGTWSTAVQQLYSVVDMNGDNGKGRVIEKNKVLANGIFMQEASAVRHGNGRDWWIINGHQNGKTYNIYLLTPNGIQGPRTFTSTNIASPHLSAAQVTFSPDGTFFAQTEGFNTCRLSRFDRCAGLLYDVYDIDMGADPLDIMGVSFSPSSKVMYVSSPSKVFQFDLTAADIAASKQVVAVLDTVQVLNVSTFFHAVLGPNGKIYIGATNGVSNLHIIHHPDSLGMACMVEQKGLELPTYNYFIMPNVPHYRLYDWPGSICDTLGIDAPIVETQAPPSPAVAEVLWVFPNPANNHITLFVGNEQIARWQIHSSTGQLLAQGIGNTGSVEVSTALFPTGLMVCSVVLADGSMATKKVMIQH